MNEFRLVYPMFALVLLTATVLVVLFLSRVRAVQQGSVSSKYFRIYQGEVEPEQSAKASRHFTNLFEAPTLFYAACLAGLGTHDGGGPAARPGVALRGSAGGTCRRTSGRQQAAAQDESLLCRVADPAGHVGAGGGTCSPCPSIIYHNIHYAK